LVDDDRSAIDIVFVSRFPAGGEQMTMRPDEILRLKAPGVMHRLEEPREKASSSRLSEDENSRRW
jgi:hypothetical protein